MIGYGVASTAFAGLAITMVIRRESGVLKRIRATPLPPWTYLVAVLVSTFITFLIEASVLILLGHLLFSVAWPARPFSLFLVLVVGAAAFAAMGLGLTGFIRSAEGSSAVVNFVYLPMAIISGTFFTPKDYPGVPARDREPLAAHLLHEADPRRDGVPSPHLERDRSARGRARLGRRRPGLRAAQVPLAAAGRLMLSG